MTPRSIVFVVPELLPVPAVRGGAVEHWVDVVSAKMRHPGRRLAVVSRPAETPGTEGIEYIPIRWTKAERVFQSLKDRVTWRNPLRYLAKIQNVTAYGLRVAHAVRDFDLIYIHNEPNLLGFIRPRPNQRVVLHMHNDHLRARPLRPLYRRLLRRASVVLFVSDYVRKRAADVFPESSGRFATILNGTDPETFRPYGPTAVEALRGRIEIDNKYTYLLYAGRLTPIKGVHILIEAFRELRIRWPDLRLIIVGSSFFEGATRTPYEDRLLELVKPMLSAVAFTGYIDHAALKYLYSAVDVVVVPSIWQEPCGLVVLEAMASGTCIVATGVGGTPELVDQEVNGLLVEPDDAHAMAEAIHRVLADPSLKERLEAAARQRAQAVFTWDRVVQQIEATFASLT
jgi:spore coat protein SA